MNTDKSSRINKRLVVIGVVYFWVTLSDLTTADPPSLVFSYHSSIHAGHKQDAKQFSRVALILLKKQVNYPMEVKLSEDNLLKLGQDIHKGIIHIGIVHGVEYWVLSKKIKPLEILVAVDQPGKIGWVYQLIMNDKNLNERNLADWKRRQIGRISTRAIFPGTTPVHDKLVEHWLGKSFAVKNELLETPADALEQVAKGNKDFTIVRKAHYNTWTEDNQSLNKNLSVVVSSNTFPRPVLIGMPAKINALEKGMWKQLQRQLIALQNTPEGEELFSFWGITGLAEPTKVYTDRVKLCFKKYPFLKEILKE